MSEKTVSSFKKPLNVDDSKYIFVTTHLVMVITCSVMNTMAK